VDDAISNTYLGVEVPIPIQLFKNIEFERVEVESSDPTVNCEEVAIRDSPSADEVMMELAAKDVALVPPLATEIVPESCVVETLPVKVESERQVFEIAKHPFVIE
jgi:hypothetical protein